jgi:chromosome segregation ATPase
VSPLVAVAGPDEVADLCTGSSTADFTPDAVTQMQEIAASLEKELMSDAEMRIQSQLLLSQLMTVEETNATGASAQDLHRAERELREANARAASAGFKFVQAQSEITQLTSENAELNKNNTEWYAQVEALKPKLAELEETSKMETNRLNQKVAYLQTQVDTSRSKCTGLESRIETLTAGHDRTKSEVMDEDATMELQAAIEEAEGLYKQVDELEKQVQSQDATIAKQTEVIAGAQADTAHHDLKTKYFEEEIDFLRKKVNFANEGYRDAKLETRNQQREIESLKRQVHDYDFRILSMDAERAIVIPRLSANERDGLAMLNISNATSGEKADELSGTVSRIAVLAAEHQQKLDLEQEENQKALDTMKDSLDTLMQENESVKTERANLRIELGTAKLARNQFLNLSRDLKSQLDSAVEENETTVDYYMKEMKFFSDQFATVKESDVALQKDVDLENIMTRASELEALGGSQWSGVQGDISQFSTLLTKPER